MKRFVNFFTCFIFVILFLGMSVSNIFAFSGGPPDGRTGSPADGGLTCNATGCHNDFTLNTAGRVAFSITPPANYTPGTAQNVTVSFDNLSGGTFGFELSALDSGNNHAGTFSALDANTQTNVSTNYIKQTTAGNSHGANASWDVQFTPSVGTTGTITFYAAGNEADGGASPANDYIYTATAMTTEVGVSADPVPDVKINGDDGPVTRGTSATATVTVSLNAGGNTSPADWWVYATSDGTTFWFTLDLGWLASAAPIRTHAGALFDLSTVTVLPAFSLPVGDYVFNFSVDDNMDGVKDDTYTDSASLTVRNVSFSQDIVPLFNSTAGTGAWFPYGDPDIANGSPATACGACHAGDVNNDGVEQCPPDCHLLDLNTHAGWLAGADDGSEPILGESSVGATDYDWSHAKLRKRLRNNRMPPGIPFNIDEANRDGGDVVLSGAADGNDIDLGGQFSVKVEGATGRGEVEYGGADNAIGLLSAYVATLDGTPTTYAGSVGPVVFADVAGLFSQPNVWFNGGLSCTACHYCAEEPPCFHDTPSYSSELLVLSGVNPPNDNAAF